MKEPKVASANPELRARMRTLDDKERKYGWFAVGFGGLAVLYYVPRLLHNTTQTLTAAKTSHGTCPSGYSIVAKVCTQYDITHPADYVPYFIALVAMTAVLIGAIVNSKRTLATFVSFFAGLAAGSLLSLPLFLYGGWLLLRAWRIQRYGATDAATVRKVSVERAAARKEARRSGTEAAATATSKAPPTPSKRYTPKAKPKKRRPVT